MHILIVDDQPYIRITTKMLLKHLPHIKQISEAGNGCEAIQFLEKNQPDLILMDVRMPILDGIEATREIKRKQPQTPIIALSYTNHYETEAIEAGADKFVLKRGDYNNILKEVIRFRHAGLRPYQN